MRRINASSLLEPLSLIVGLIVYTYEQSSSYQLGCYKQTQLGFHDATSARSCALVCVQIFDSKTIGFEISRRVHGYGSCCDRQVLS